MSMDNEERRKHIEVALRIARICVMAMPEQHRVNMAVRIVDSTACSEEDFFSTVDFLASDSWEELLIETSAGLSPGCR